MLSKILRDFCTRNMDSLHLRVKYYWKRNQKSNIYSDRRNKQHQIPHGKKIKRQWVDSNVANLSEEKLEMREIHNFTFWRLWLFPQRTDSPTHFPLKITPFIPRRQLEIMRRDREKGVMRGGWILEKSDPRLRDRSSVIIQLSGPIRQRVSQNTWCSIARVPS